MEHNTTDRLSDQQQRYLQHRSQTSTSMWTATGQAVQKQEDQQRALSLVITLLGATINYGSRTQATITFSSAEAELHVINTGATEALHLRNLLMEIFNVQKVNIKIYKGSSSGKSMATRIGSSRKSKPIDLKHLCIQQLISHDIVRLNKNHANENPADIFTKYISTETLRRHLQASGLNTQHNIHYSVGTTPAVSQEWINS